MALRNLRAAAGLTIRDLADRTGYSPGAISEAAGGGRLPGLELTTAFARCCGADPKEWEQRWRQATTQQARAREAHYQLAEATVVHADENDRVRQEAQAGVDEIQASADEVIGRAEADADAAAGLAETQLAEIERMQKAAQHAATADAGAEDARVEATRAIAKPLVVSIVDDHPDLCYGVLARLPRVNSSFAAGVMAATVPEFLARDDEADRRSDVVLLDLTLKDESSPADNVGRLKDAGYPVVIYTGEERPNRLQATLGIGADALVRKEEADRLEEALTAVISGDHGWVSPLMAAVVLAAPGPRLSPTQVEVLRLYATGVSAQQIALLLRCSVETVKTHLKAVKTRYEAHGDQVFTKTDLLRVALRDRHLEQDWYLRGQ